MSRNRESPLHQLTVRGLDKELEQPIRRLAKVEGVSLNEAVLRLLRKGAGLGPSGQRRDVVGSSLDHLKGTWTAEEAREFEESIASLEKIDEEMWAPPPAARKRPQRR